MPADAPRWREPPPDEDGLAALVNALGREVKACPEMMSGAAWVLERLQAAGSEVELWSSPVAAAPPPQRIPQ